MFVAFPKASASNGRVQSCSSSDENASKDATTEILVLNFPQVSVSMWEGLVVLECHQ